MSLIAESRSFPVRVWISYAHDNQRHRNNVRRFAELLRSLGVEVHLDVYVADEPQDWPLWMVNQSRAATYVLVVVSPEYRRRAEGDAAPDEGRGVQFEAMLIRNEMYANLTSGRKKFLPVVLPGGSSSDIPAWLGGVASTKYQIKQFNTQSVEELLRYLTGQPSHIAPPIGSVPVLPPAGIARTDDLRNRDRSGSRLVAEQGAFAKDEMLLQAQVRQLLTLSDIGLNDNDLGLDLRDQEGHRHLIDIACASTVIQVQVDGLSARVRNGAERKLAQWMKEQTKATGRPYTAVVTDGGSWRLYRLSGHKLREVDSLHGDRSRPDLRAVVAWLEAVLATGQHIAPSPRHVVAKLGADSPSCALGRAMLTDLFEQGRRLPGVEVKRRLWGKLLSTALGTKFDDGDVLFIDHTLLVVMAEVIGHAIIGADLRIGDLSGAQILSGRYFAEADVRGVVEPDFFDWVLEVDGGDEFVKEMVRRLTRFDWDDVEHDVLKLLYESIIGPETRRQLGEYYTPDWLAESIVKATADAPLTQRILDASCGSGTFLFHAVRAFLAAADSQGWSDAVALDRLVKQVIGIDVHPVAVTLARVTYLLAIGRSRIRARFRQPFTVPVYLGDSLRWASESHLLTYPGLNVSTADDHEMFVDPLQSSPGEHLFFPDALVDDAPRFDQVVNEMADLATQRPRESVPPPLHELLNRFEIARADQPGLKLTFRRMCQLHDEQRDHIWAYYVRNLARPLWLARDENRVDVLVGNPPWLSYHNMTDTQQTAFRSMSKERGLWAGGSVATNQDLSALFVARCVELYLRPGGRFSFVMPWATLSRRQYRGFRSGSYPVQAEPVRVLFDRPWDLDLVKPTFFPVPACVVSGHRSAGDQSAVPLVLTPEIWSGQFDTATASWSEAAPHIGRNIGEAPPSLVGPGSPYRARFHQGATIVPRFMFLIEPDPLARNSLDPGHRIPVRSRRTPSEKPPWKSLPQLRGRVEEQFVVHACLGEYVLPFRCGQPTEIVVPWDGDRLLDGSDPDLNRYRGLARWWRQAEGVWRDNQASTRLTLIERLDFHRGLSSQFPIAPIRVVYNKSGKYLAATILRDRRAVLDHKLYWAAARDLHEARYLVAILNSTVLTLAVRPLQGRGEHNPRDFDKHIWSLPIPAYDHDRPAHRELVELATQAERIAAAVELPSTRFEAKRRRIRGILEADGVAAKIDSIVKKLLSSN